MARCLHSCKLDAMDEIQLQHERAVGDQFIDWLNKRDGSHFTFSCRGKEAPDLVYTDAGRILGVEIVDAYYDAADAKRHWKGARKAPDAPKRWSGADPDRRLLGDIDWQIRKKCKRSYGPNGLLVVTVRPAITSEIDMEELLRDLELPDKIRFVGVYLSGHFPIAVDVGWEEIVHVVGTSVSSRDRMFDFPSTARRCID